MITSKLASESIYRNIHFVFAMVIAKSMRDNVVCQLSVNLDIAILAINLDVVIHKPDSSNYLWSLFILSCWRTVCQKALLSHQSSILLSFVTTLLRSSKDRKEQSESKICDVWRCRSRTVRLWTMKVMGAESGDVMSRSHITSLIPGIPVCKMHGPCPLYAVVLPHTASWVSPLCVESLTPIFQPPIIFTVTSFTYQLWFSPCFTKPTLVPNVTRN